MSAESLIESYITTLNDQKVELTDEAISLANSAAAAIFGFATPSQDLLGFESIEVTFDDVTAPTEASTRYTVSPMPTPREHADVDPDIDIDESDFPERPDLESDGLRTIDEPGAAVKTFTDNVPNVSTATRSVTVPSIKAFDPLELLPVTLPDTDITTVLPSFSAQAPPFLGQDSYDLTGQTRTDYATALADIRAIGEGRLDAFLAEHFPTYQAQISALDTYLDDFINGRTTSWAQQTTIYNKRRTQTEAERERLNEEVARRRARGGSVIDMALDAASLRIEQASHDANVLAAYEVAEQVADREQRHLEVVLSLLNGLRKAALDAWMAYHNIMLAEHEEARQFAQLILGAAVQSHNLAVQRYNGDLTKYRAEAKVFETKLKSALVEYELLERKLAVVEASNDANQSIIAARRAELEAESQKIDLYVAEIRGLAEELALRRFPLEIFEAKIRAHEAYLSGRRTEADIYQALVQGQRAVTDRDLARVRIYGEETDAWRKRVDALLSKQQITLNYNEDVRQRIAMELDVIKTEIQRDQASNRTALDVQDQAINIWREQNQTQLQDAERRSRDERANLQARVEYDRMLADYIVSILNHGVQRARAIADVHNQAAATIGDLGAAALAANGSNISLINETLNS